MTLAGGATGAAQMDFDWGPLVKPGVVATVLCTLAGGIAWLLNWNQARENGRAAELRAREDAVFARENAYAEKVEERMAGLEAQLGVLDDKHARLLKKFNGLRGSLVEVTVELKVHSPGSAALARAEAHLEQTYPDYHGAPDPTIRPAEAAIIEKLDRMHTEEGKQ